MYSRTEYLQSDDCAKSAMARSNSGCAWNRKIADSIIVDLHNKLLPFPSGDLIEFVPVLTLVGLGWFGTAKSIVQTINADNADLDAVKQWLVTTLTEADDTEGG